MIAPAGARIRGRSRPFRPMHGNRCYVKLTNESQSRRDPLPGRLAHLAGPSLTSLCTGPSRLFRKCFLLIHEVVHRTAFLPVENVEN